MMLAERQRAMLAMLRGELAADAFARDLGQPLNRVALYRDFVRGHVSAILTKLFPQALALLEDKASLEDAFYRQHPPGQRDLNLAGAPFPEFLDQHGHAFAAAVAQLEWEIFAAAVHPAVLTANEPTLNPTLSLFEQHHPAVQHLAKGPLPQPVARLSPPQVVMVFRRASNHAVVFRVLDETSARVLTALSEGRLPSGDDLAHGLELGIVIGA